MSWRYAAASVIGTSHQKVGLPCQDRFACSVRVPGWFIAAVCDGAGSAAQSEIGAETASATALEFIEKALNSGRATDCEAVVRDAAAAARVRLLARASEFSVAPRELACTLLVVMLGPAGGAAAQVGDGLIAAKADADGWTWIFWPQRGEYANVTKFLSEDDALDALEVSPLGPEIFECSLMTDGLEPLALQYATRTAHSPFFEGLLAPLRSMSEVGEATELSARLNSFLDSPRIRDRADDDLTLAIACRTRTDASPPVS